jgi:alpha-acetolactate decarboxylase
VENCPDLSYLTSQFDALRQTDNFLFALRVDGTFDYIHARAMRRTKDGDTRFQVWLPLATLEVA